MPTEIWKSVTGFEVYYEVSNFGNIRSVSRDIVCKDKSKKHICGKIISPAFVKGYKRVLLLKNNERYNKFVHRLVAESFLPNLLSLRFVNHKNGKREDANATNLEWCTQKENMNDPLTLVARFDSRITLNKSIKAINIETGKEYLFDSINDAARFIGEKSPGSISSFFKGGRRHVKGFVFENTDNPVQERIALYESIIKICTNSIEKLSKSRLGKR